VENFVPVVRTLQGALAPRVTIRYFAGPENYAITSLSDVAVMNTVTWGPESSPRTPHRAHVSLCSWVNHHVERGTKVVTRPARSSDWERLSGRWQAPLENELSTIEEDALLAKASICRSNSWVVARTTGSFVEGVRPGLKEWMEGIEGHTSTLWFLLGPLEST